MVKGALMTVELRQPGSKIGPADEDVAVKVQPAPEVLRHVVDQLRSSGNAAYKAGNTRGAVS